MIRLVFSVLPAPDSPLGVTVRAAALLARLTARSTSADLGASYSAAEESADDLAMEWDDWLGEHLPRLKWDSAAGRFTGAE